MPRVTSPRARIAAALPIVLVLTACPRDSVRFETHTIVSEDGAVSRTTRFAVTGPDALRDESGDLTPRGELDAYYTVPEGGAWTTETRPYEEDGETRHETYLVYSVEKRYPPGATIRSDHIREGADGTGLRNAVHVEATNFFFVRTFEFAEHQVVARDDDQFRDVLARDYASWKTVLTTALSDRLPNISPSQASAAIASVCDPWVQKILDGVYIEEAQHFAELDNDDLVDALAAELATPPNTRDAIEDAVNQADSSSDDSKLYDLLMGPYSECALCSYRFVQTLSLPGVIGSSNAGARDGNVLTWEYGEHDVLLQGYRMRASSRLVYPERIAMGALALLVLTFIVVRRARSAR